MWLRRTRGRTMTALEYRTALTTLGLTQQAAGRWLRVSPKTAQNYAKHGPSGPAAVAIGLALIVKKASDDLNADNAFIAVSGARFALDLVMNQIERERK